MNTVTFSMSFTLITQFDAGRPTGTSDHLISSPAVPPSHSDPRRDIPVDQLLERARRLMERLAQRHPEMFL